MAEKITITDIENEAGLNEKAGKEAAKIIKRAEKEFAAGANTSLYETGEMAGIRRIGHEELYCNRLKDQIQAAHPDWKVNLEPIINSISMGRGETSEEPGGFDIEIIKE